MIGFNKNKIKKQSMTNKTFSYSREASKTGRELSLDFTLNIEDKNEIKNFLEMLKVAQEEVEKELG